MHSNLLMCLTVLGGLFVFGCRAVSMEPQTWKLRITDSTLYFEDPLSLSVTVSEVGENRVETYVEEVIKKGRVRPPVLLEVVLDDVNHLSAGSYWRMIHPITNYLRIGGDVRVKMKSDTISIEYSYATEHPTISPEEIIGNKTFFNLSAKCHYLLITETRVILNGKPYKHEVFLDQQAQRYLRAAPLFVFFTPSTKIKKVITTLQSLNSKDALFWFYLLI